MTDKDTVKFTVPSDDKENMRRILRNVYEALTEKGYNPPISPTTTTPGA